MKPQKIIRSVIFVTTAMSTFMLSGNAEAQEYNDYLLKKVGNLYIVNVGANEGIKDYKIYNLYFEQAKKFPIFRFKYNTKRVYFGTVQVTQVFPEYSVVRILSKVMEGDPVGDRIVLVPQGLTEKVLQNLQSRYSLPLQTIELLRDKPIKETEVKPVIKSIENEIKSESYKPVSIGITYFRDFDQIAEPVTDNLIANINETTYTGDRTFSSSFSTNGGIGITASKMLMRYVSVEGGFAIIQHESVLNSFRNENSVVPEGLISVNNWDFNIKTRVINWSLTFQISKLSKARSYFTRQTAGRPFTPRLGFGVNYATVNVNMNHDVLIDKLTGDDKRSLTDKGSIGGYWGLHAVAGIDYYFQFMRYFAEINYNSWFSDKFDANFPFRVGAAINF